MVIESGIEHDDYLQQLFRGGTSSIILRNFIFQTFSIINFILPAIKDQYQKCICMKCFREGITKSWISYQFYHKEWVEKLAARTVVNKYFNNEQKHTNDSVKKEKIVDFKKRQRQRKKE